MSNLVENLLTSDDSGEIVYSVIHSGALVNAATATALPLVSVHGLKQIRINMVLVVPTGEDAVLTLYSRYSVDGYTIYKDGVSETATLAETTFPDNVTYNVSILLSAAELSMPYLHLHYVLSGPTTGLSTGTTIAISGVRGA
jgi:hypothetical protein